MAEVLRLHDVWIALDRGHDRVSVLDGASLSVDAGEIVAVVAGAGQGKTTLVRLASGTLPPDRGVVSIGGVELSRWSHDRRTTGQRAEQHRRRPG